MSRARQNQPHRETVKTAKTAAKVVGMIGGGTMARPRIRFSAPARRLVRSDAIAAMEAAALPTETHPDDVLSGLTQAFDVYETDLGLAPASRKARETQRERILGAIERLQRIMDEPRSQELLGMLATYYASKHLDALFRGGPLPEGPEMGSVPQWALRENLSELRLALLLRKWPDEDEPEAAGGCSYFQRLVGELSEVFMEAFRVSATATNRGEGTFDSPFERFARVALERSGIEPKPSDTTIGDALDGYRASLTRT